jgi:putative transposase
MKVTLSDIIKRSRQSKATIWRRSKKENWPVSGTTIVNYKVTKQYNLKDLPPDIQALFMDEASSEPRQLQGGSFPGVTPFTEGQVTVPAPHALQTPHRQKDNGQRSSSECPFSEKARQVALARIDLLKAWEEYRESHPHGSQTRATGEFLALYNSGQLLPKVYETLGKVSKSTLYAWKARLEDSSDWRKLVPGQMRRERKGARLTDEESRVFLNLLLNPHKFRIGTAIRLAKHICKKKGIDVTRSDGTYRRFAIEYRRKHYDLWVFLREGIKALRDRVEPSIMRDPDKLAVGDCLVADGHRLNFHVINPFTGKPCRAVLVGFVDWKSYDLVGWEIMLEENTQCIASALRNAIITLGRVPKLVYLDNGKAFRGRFFTSTESFEETGFYGLFGRLGIGTIFARPYNARAKIIERWFREFTDTFERLLPSYTGSSIEDRPAYLKRNEKFHRALHSGYVPTIEEVKEWLNTWHEEFHRSQPCPHVSGRTIGEVFDQGRGRGVNIDELDDLMMAVKRARITRHGIRFLNADYYDDNLYGLTDRVIIRYSLFDLSYIKVYTEDGEFLCKADRVMPVHPVAEHLGDVRDVEELKRRIAQQRRLERQTIRAAREIARQGGSLPEIDWGRVAEESPKVIDRLEEEGVRLPPGEEIHIPEEICQSFDESDTSDSKGLSDEEVIALVEAGKRRPYFLDDLHHFTWLCKFGIKTEKDREFFERYKKTEEYKRLFGKEIEDSNLDEQFYIDYWWDWCHNEWKQKKWLPHDAAIDTTYTRRSIAQ